MNDITPTFADWYPDAATGGTKYWDGKRWTGDTRPPRKAFAASARRRDMVPAALMGGISFAGICIGAFFEEESDSGSSVGWLLAGIVIALIAIGSSIYLFRGQGPTTESIKARIEAEEKSAKNKRRSANIASFAQNFGRRGRPHHYPPPVQADATTGNLSAIASGETTRSLEKLQHLWYSGAITDAEHQAAKDKVLGTHQLNDPFAQVAKLAELHRDGVLGDMEFAAAKARVLGL